MVVELYLRNAKSSSTSVRERQFVLLERAIAKLTLSPSFDTIGKLVAIIHYEKGEEKVR